MRKLTLDQVKRYAMRNYEYGGHVIIECWTDDDILNWIEEYGYKEQLNRVLNIYIG